MLVDDLSRPGVRVNYDWLKDRDHVQTALLSVTADPFRRLLTDWQPDVVVHLAAQVGVQASIKDPEFDLRTNILGTFHVLQACRRLARPPLVIFASTNKVYGDIQVDEPVSEEQPLKFCTPYGCSKGAAEQYVLDYARVYGLPGVVLRMSCVYGTRQFGTEEQGWLAHFARAKQAGESVTVYGTGEQVRDVLFVDDYVRLIERLIERRHEVAGEVFNVGGGEWNTISVNECLRKLGNTKIHHAPERAADQRYYVSDIAKVRRALGWVPEIGVEEGLDKLQQWVSQLSR